MKNLLNKLVKITEEMKGLEKTGQNQAQKYKYVAGAEAMKKFRELEVKHNVKVLTSVRESSLKITEKVNDKNTAYLTTAIVDFTIYDLDSGEHTVVSIPSQGYDSTDKSVFKLQTGAYKYFLLQTFSYSTDDPEDDSNEVGTTTEFVKPPEKRVLKTAPTTKFKPSTLKKVENGSAVTSTVNAKPLTSTTTPKFQAPKFGE